MREKRNAAPFEQKSEENTAEKGRKSVRKGVFFERGKHLDRAASEKKRNANDSIYLPNPERGNFAGLRFSPCSVRESAAGLFSSHKQSPDTASPFCPARHTETATASIPTTLSCSPLVSTPPETADSRAAESDPPETPASSRAEK